MCQMQPLFQKFLRIYFNRRRKREIIKKRSAKVFHQVILESPETSSSSGHDQCIGNAERTHCGVKCSLIDFNQNAEWWYVSEQETGLLRTVAKYCQWRTMRSVNAIRWMDNNAQNWTWKGRRKLSHSIERGNRFPTRELWPVFNCGDDGYTLTNTTNSSCLICSWSLNMFSRLCDHQVLYIQSCLHDVCWVLRKAKTYTDACVMCVGDANR